MDIRRIIPAERVEAVRLKHILLASEDLAKECLNNLRDASVGFEELASSLSSCTFTRDKGGEIGWVNTYDDDRGDGLSRDGGASSDAELLEMDFLEEVLPKNVRDAICSDSNDISGGLFALKPGDVTLIESSRGYHLLKVEDVMLDGEHLLCFIFILLLNFPTYIFHSYR